MVARKRKAVRRRRVLARAAPRRITRTVLVRAPRRRMVKRKSKRRIKRNMFGPILSSVMFGGLYGAFRAPVNSLAKNVPIVGNLGDEAGLLVMNSLIASNTSGPIKRIAKSGIAIEAARVGEQLLGGSLNLGKSSNGNGGGLMKV